MTFNGAESDFRFFVLNLIWLAIVIFVAWPLTIFNLRRLYGRYLLAPTKQIPLRVQWMQIFTLSILATIAGVDPSCIYSDEFSYVRAIAIGKSLIEHTNSYFFQKSATSGMFSIVWFCASTLVHNGNVYQNNRVLAYSLLSGTNGWIQYGRRTQTMLPFHP